MELKYMKNPECRRNSVRKYKAGNTWVQTGGLPVPTFSFPACSLKLNWLLAIIRRPTCSKLVLSHTPYRTHLGGLGRFSVSQFLLISFISSPLACWRSCQTPKNLRPWKVVLCPFWLYLLCIFYRKKRLLQRYHRNPYSCSPCHVFLYSLDSLIPVKPQLCFMVVINHQSIYWKYPHEMPIGKHSCLGFWHKKNDTWEWILMKLYIIFS